MGKNRTKKHKGGIGLLISDDIDILNDNLFNSCKDDVERMWVKLKLNNINKPMYIAVVYFPVEGMDHELTDELYNQLLSEIIQIENMDGDGEPHILITGDMNARIGDRIPFRDPVRNNNGNRLLSFSNDSGMTIINCSKMYYGKITWTRGPHTSTIDYILGSHSIMGKVRKMVVDEKGNYHMGSDHNVLILNVKGDTNTTTKETNTFPKNHKRIVWDINRNQNWSNYQQEINNQFSDWDNHKFHDANALWDSWKSKLIIAATSTIGVKELKNNNKCWLNKDITKSVEERKRANRNHRQWLKSENRIPAGDDLWNTYKEKNKFAKKLVKRKIMQNRIDKSIEITQKGGPGCKDFWTNNLRGSKKSSDRLNSLKLPMSDEITTDKQVMKQTIMHYFHTLGKMNLNLNDKYNTNKSRTNILNNDDITAGVTCNTQINDIQFTVDDVRLAVNEAKNNKAPGLDGITNELIKNGGHGLVQSLYSIFTAFRDFEQIPDEWNKGIIIPIHKKGSKNDLSNYRGITLNSCTCISKIYNRLVAKTLSSYLEDNNLLSEIQGGFRTDHIFTLKCILTCRQAEGKKTHLAFLDFKKAFDTIWRDGLLKAVWDIGIRGRIWR